LAPKDYETAVGQFESDWETYIRVDLHDEVLDTTRELIQRYGLRAFDAIHLASATDLRKALGEAVDFVAADKRLLEAATAEGLGSIDAEDGVPR
jgi:predicted nucleic acid-binding protein